MVKPLKQLIQEGHGEIYRYRDFHGNQIPGGKELVWNVDFDGERYTLYHYGTPLVHWKIRQDGSRDAWLSWYSVESIDLLTTTDKRGIRLVRYSLI